MKTLIESILADIDDTISSGDNLFKEELETVQGIKNLALWEKYVSHNGYKGKFTQYTYIWKCPNCLSSVGIEEYNAIELAMTYNTSDSPIGPAGWTITMHIKCSYNERGKKLCPQICIVTLNFQTAQWVSMTLSYLHRKEESTLLP